MRKNRSLVQTGTIKVKPCTLWSQSFLLLSLFRFCAFNPASASPCCVDFTCNYPRLIYHLQPMCSLALRTAGLGSCLLRIRLPFVISPCLYLRVNPDRFSLLFLIGSLCVPRIILPLTHPFWPTLLTPHSASLVGKF